MVVQNGDESYCIKEQHHMKQIQELVMYTYTLTVDVCPKIFDYMLYKYLE